MRISLILFFVAGLFSLSFHLNKPAFNGTDPGCGGSGCHNLQEGVTTTSMLANLQIEVTVHGVSQGEPVGGELVNSSGTVVDVVEATSSNPFTLTAPGEGEYQVNAGFISPNGLWDSSKVTITVSDLEDEIVVTPESFHLSQNHPNPFNSQTIIRFFVAKAGQVRLDVFNINGERIRSLAQNYFQQGHHSIKWNGKDEKGVDVPSGVYIYRMTTKNNSLSQRMILSK